MLASLTGRRERFLVAEVDTTTGAGRIVRTLAFDASAPRVRDLVAPLVDELSARRLEGWHDGVLVIDPRPGARLYLLPLIPGVLARWDVLLDVHRQRAREAAAAGALAAMGAATDAGIEHVRGWLAAGATDRPPAGGGPAYVPAAREPVTDAEWFGMERRAQLLARLLPIARDLDPSNPLRLAHYIAARLLAEEPAPQRLRQ
ncbi:MAG: hypothetical protein ACRD29_20785 [Acidimicrobiales bacterium]